MTTLMLGGEVVVDLGCGAGMSLDELSQLYRVAVGLDVSKNRFDKRSRPPVGWNFVLTDVNNGIPLRSGCADVVLANQVIEHITDPRYFGQEIYRILRPSDVAVITTPNVRYIRHLWKLIVLGQGPKTGNQNERDGSWDDGHVHYFTHSDLRNIFKEVGFSGCERCSLTWQRCTLCVNSCRAT